MDDDFTMDLPDSADEPALRRVKAVARLLDDAVRVPGTDYRVGVDPVLGLLPAYGDLVSAGLSLYIVAEAANLGVPLTTIVRMLGNVGLDAAVGTVPVIGTLFDAVWKANQRNVRLLERALDADRVGERGGEGGAGDGPVTIEIEDDDGD